MSKHTKEFFQHEDDPHGIAKKVMLYRYLQSRFSELLNHRASSGEFRFTYFDAFSGPGKHVENEQGDSCIENNDIPYGDRTYGSPLVAMEALFSAMETNGKSSCDMLLVFEDADLTYFKSLKENIKQFCENEIKKPRKDKYGENYFIDINNIEEDNNLYCIVTKSRYLQFDIHIYFVHSEFLNFDVEEIMPADLQRTPGITFIDPFGYKDIPMSQVCKFLGYRKDVILNFMSSFIHRFKNVHVNNMKKLFGTENWKEEMSEQQYDQYYCRKVKQNVDKALVGMKRELKFLSFVVKRTDSKLLYDLIYLSDELKSLKIMKYAMCYSKQYTELSFCDKEFYEGEPTFYLCTDLAKEADFIYQHWKGKTCTFGEVKEWILVHSPFQYHSKALRELEKAGKLEVDSPNNERNRKALPPAVGVNHDDDDLPKSYQPYRNGWMLKFNVDDNIDEIAAMNETPPNRNKRNMEDDIANVDKAKKVKRKI